MNKIILSISIFLLCAIYDAQSMEKNGKNFPQSIALSKDSIGNVSTMQIKIPSESSKSKFVFDTKDKDVVIHLNKILEKKVQTVPNTFFTITQQSREAQSNRDQEQIQKFERMLKNVKR